jgi:hypothetical protein
MAHRFDIQTEINRQKVREGSEAQPIGYQGGPLGFESREFLPVSTPILEKEGRVIQVNACTSIATGTNDNL